MSNIMQGFNGIFANAASGSIEVQSLPKEFEIVLVRDSLDRINTAYWTSCEEHVTRDNIEWYVPSKIEGIQDVEIAAEITDWQEYKGQIA